jgi:hypothetical protein
MFDIVGTGVWDLLLWLFFSFMQRGCGRTEETDRRVGKTEIYNANPPPFSCNAFMAMGIQQITRD